MAANNHQTRQTIVRLLSSMASQKEVTQYLKRFSQLVHCLRRRTKSPSSATRVSTTWVSPLLQKGHFMMGSRAAPGRPKQACAPSGGSDYTK